MKSTRKQIYSSPKGIVLLLVLFFSFSFVFADTTFNFEGDINTTNVFWGASQPVFLDIPDYENMSYRIDYPYGGFSRHALYLQDTAGTQELNSVNSIVIYKQDDVAFQSLYRHSTSGLVAGSSTVNLTSHFELDQLYYYSGNGNISMYWQTLSSGICNANTYLRFLNNNNEIVGNVIKPDPNDLGVSNDYTSDYLGDNPFYFSKIEIITEYCSLGSNGGEWLKNITFENTLNTFGNTLPVFQNVTQNSQYICLDQNGNAEVNLTYDVYDQEGDTILYSSALTGKSRKYINFAEEFFIDTGANCQENYNYLENYIITNASVLTSDSDRILYSFLDYVSIRESDCLGILDFDTNLQDVYLHFGKTFTYDTTTNVQFGVYNTEHEFYFSPFGSKGDLFDIFYNITSAGNLTITVDGNLIYNKAKDSFIALDSVFYDLPIFNDINLRIVFDNELNTTNVSFGVFDGGIENDLTLANILLNKSYSNFEGFVYRPQTTNDDGISLSSLLVTGSQLYTVPTFSSTKIDQYTFTNIGVRNLDLYISDLLHQPFNYSQTTFTFNILDYEDERCFDYSEKEQEDVLFALRGIFRPLMTPEIQSAFDSAIWIVWFFLIGWFIWTLKKITFSIGIATTISGILAFLFASTSILISFIVLVPISWILAVGVRA